MDKIWFTKMINKIVGYIKYYYYINKIITHYLN